MSEVKTEKFTFQKIKGSKKFPVILGLGFIVVILLVFVLVYYFVNQQNDKERGSVLFSIDDKDFREGEIKEVIKYPVEVGGLPENEAVVSAFEKYKIVVIAEKLGFQPSQTVLDSYLNQVAPKNTELKTEYKSWFMLLAKVTAIEDSFGGAVSNGFSGFAHVFYFGQHIEYAEGEAPEGARDPNVVAADRAYAKERAEFYHSKLKDGSMTNEQIDQEVKNDPKVQNLVKVVNPFGKDNPLSWQDDVYYEDVIQYIKGLRRQGISDLLVGSAIPEPLQSLNDPETELYYYFVDVQELGVVASFTEDQLATAISDAKVEFFGEYDPNATLIEADNIKQTIQATEGSGE